jgi:hypothetical protein
LVSWAAALLQGVLTPIRAGECAAWADRLLGGRSAYSTYLEFASKDDEPRPAAALTRLIDWIEQAAPRSLELLESMSQRTGVMKPTAVAIVAALLAIALLQIPTHPRTHVSSLVSTALPMPAADAPGRAAERDEGEMAASAVTARPRKTGAADESREAGGLAPVAEDRHAAVEARNTDDEAPRSTSAQRAASGGRDAGDSPDKVVDPGLSEAWQGELATTLRSLSEPSEGTTRTDSTVAAEFSRETMPSSDVRGTMILVPAPAAAPEARRAARLGPAEQAYVRAYFAGSGATP